MVMALAICEICKHEVEEHASRVWDRNKDRFNEKFITWCPNCERWLDEPPLPPDPESYR